MGSYGSHRLRCLTCTHRINGNTNNITGRLEIDTECLDHVRSLRRWSTEISERAETSTGLGGEDGANYISGVPRVEDWRWSGGNSLTELEGCMKAVTAN